MGKNCSFSWYSCLTTKSLIEHTVAYLQQSAISIKKAQSIIAPSFLCANLTAKESAASTANSDFILTEPEIFYTTAFFNPFAIIISSLGWKYCTTRPSVSVTRMVPGPIAPWKRNARIRANPSLAIREVLKERPNLV